MATAETAGSRAHILVRAWRQRAPLVLRARWLAVVPLALVPVLVLAGAAPAETPGVTSRESRSSAPGNVEGSAASAFPSVSAAGRHVAFESDAPNLVPGDANGVRDVFLRDRGPDRQSRDDDRTVLVSVPPGGGQFDGRSSGASVSADGRYVAFEAQRAKLFSDTTVSSSLDVVVFADDRGEAGGADLWRMEPDGTDLRRLTATPDAAEHDPQWSPDRSRIAFVRGVADADAGGIWTMDADGGDLQQLTAPVGADFDASPPGRRTARASRSRGSSPGRTTPAASTSWPRRAVIPQHGPRSPRPTPTAVTASPTGRRTAAGSCSPASGRTAGSSPRTTARAAAW